MISLFSRSAIISPVTQNPNDSIIFYPVYPDTYQVLLHLIKFLEFVIFLYVYCHYPNQGSNQLMSGWEQQCLNWPHCLQAFSLKYILHTSTILIWNYFHHIIPFLQWYPNNAKLPRGPGPPYSFKSSSRAL